MLLCYAMRRVAHEQMSAEREQLQVPPILTKPVCQAGSAQPATNLAFGPVTVLPPGIRHPSSPSLLSRPPLPPLPPPPPPPPPPPQSDLIQQQRLHHSTVAAHEHSQAEPAANLCPCGHRVLLSTFVIYGRWSMRPRRAAKPRSAFLEASEPEHCCCAAAAARSNLSTAVSHRCIGECRYRYVAAVRRSDARHAALCVQRDPNPNPNPNPGPYFSPVDGMYRPSFPWSIA